MGQRTGIYRGVVRSTADPLGKARVRLQVAQVTGSALTSWVPPAQAGGALPKVGEQVYVLYENGDVSYPAYVPPIAPPPVVPEPPVTLLQDWTTVSLATGFSTNGNGNGDPAYRVLRVLGSTKVEWKGGIIITYPSGTIANDGIWTAAPLSIAPTSLRSTSGACSTAGSTLSSLKVDFQTGGMSRIVGTNGTTISPSWVSLNSIEYYL